MPLISQRVRHIIPISGKDSLCTAIVQMAREESLPYEFLFCDVKMELPETYAWLNTVEKKLDINIVRVGKSLREIMDSKVMLPSHQRRFCTEYGKIQPLIKHVGNYKAVQYVGIRADEGRPIPTEMESNIQLRYPLVECGIDLPGVYSILGSRDLLPPTFFWQRLWDAVYEICSDVSRKWLGTQPPWVISHLFSWRSRSNCYMCFYQRLYEWVGLLEHHPDLFEEAERLEQKHGSVQGDDSYRNKNFTWRSDGPLRTIRARALELFETRVQQVHRAVVGMRHKAEDGEFDLLSLTSCGNYCGK